MRISRFGRRFGARTGILELMEDLGDAGVSREPTFMLGGGNPALIPEVSRLWRSCLADLARDPGSASRTLGTYDSAQGKASFLEAVAGLLRNEYGWPVTAANIAVTNGSQIAFFYLLNMFAGPADTDDADQMRRILFPICPEYIGYAGQGIVPGMYQSCRPVIEELPQRMFKYRVDFDRLEITPDVGALCVSRPTNPTGNVLTDTEMRRLMDLAASHDVPLLVDNAYGLPFPGIVFEDASPVWDEHVVLVLSLSKIGLPSVRTGIVVARPEIIRALTATNAVCSLATGGIGQALVEPLIRSKEILRVAQDVVRPFYRERSRLTLEMIHEELAGACDYRVHRSEGAFFLWIWLRGLPVAATELYRRLKERRVFVIPGSHFFYGLAEPWAHADECIRLSYAQDEDTVRSGIRIIADEIRRVA